MGRGEGPWGPKLPKLSIGCSIQCIIMPVAESRQNWTPIEIGPMGPFLISKLDRGSFLMDCAQLHRQS